MSMPIHELIESQLGTYENADPAWEQFIRDHFTYLWEGAKIHKPTAAYMRPHEYNLKFYLKSISFDISAEWIVRLLNDITTDIDFINITEIRVPDMGIVKELYQTFKTNQANKG